MAHKKKKNSVRSTRPSAVVFALWVAAGILLGSTALSLAGTIIPPTTTTSVATNQSLPWLYRPAASESVTSSAAVPSQIPVTPPIIAPNPTDLTNSVANSALSLLRYLFVAPEQPTTSVNPSAIQLVSPSVSTTVGNTVPTVPAITPQQALENYLNAVHLAISTSAVTTLPSATVYPAVATAPTSTVSTSTVPAVNSTATSVQQAVSAPIIATPPAAINPIVAAPAAPVTIVTPTPVNPASTVSAPQFAAPAATTPSNTPSAVVPAGVTTVLPPTPTTPSVPAVVQMPSIPGGTMSANQPVQPGAIPCGSDAAKVYLWVPCVDVNAFQMTPGAPMAPGVQLVPAGPASTPPTPPVPPAGSTTLQKIFPTIPPVAPTPTPVPTTPPSPPPAKTTIPTLTIGQKLAKCMNGFSAMDKGPVLFSEKSISDNYIPPFLTNPTDPALLHPPMSATPMEIRMFGYYTSCYPQVQDTTPVSHPAAPSFGSCMDLMDNDGDNKTDSADAGCGMNPSNEFTDQLSPNSNCKDMVDNNQNNVTDLADPGCSPQRILNGTASESMTY